MDRTTTIAANPEKVEPVRSGTVSVFIVTAFFALAAGAAELGVVAVRKFAADEIIRFGPHLVWMTPVSYLLFFLPLALLLAAATGLAPRRETRFALLFAPSFLAVASVLYLFNPALHRLAILALALGVGAQLARWLMPRYGRFVRMARTAVVCALAVLPALAAGVAARGALKERRALAALGAAPAGTPNIILIVLDTVRAISMSLYGYGRPTTPALARYAPQGILFTRAYSTAPWTLASHASLFTGVYPPVGGAGWVHPLGPGLPTLAERLDRAGYRTAGFVANLDYTEASTGLARGFTHYEDYPVSLAEVALSSSLGRLILDNRHFRTLIGYHDLIGRKRAPRVNDELLGWLSSRRGRRPFFAFLNYYDAHEPYLPGPALERRFGATARDKTMIFPDGPRVAGRAKKRRMSEAQRAAEQSAYDASLAGLDAALGDLFARLRERGVLQNTVVIVTSDHGEQFGEHGLFTHGNSVYSPAIHVPLLIWGPGIERGAVDERPVSLRDLPSTILRIAGAAPGELPGTPLLDRAGSTVTGPTSPVYSYVQPAPNQLDWGHAARGPLRSLVLGRFHYIRQADGREELYDLATDPGETRDLASDPAMRAELRAGRDALQDLSGDGSAARSP